MADPKDKKKKKPDEKKGPKKPGVVRKLVNFLLVALLVAVAITSLSYKSYYEMWPWEPQQLPRYWKHLRITVAGLKMRTEDSAQVTAKAEDIHRYGELLQEAAEAFQDGQEELAELDYSDALDEFKQAKEQFEAAHRLLPDERLAVDMADQAEVLIRQCTSKLNEEE